MAKQTTHVPYDKTTALAYIRARGVSHWNLSRYRKKGRIPRLTDQSVKNPRRRTLTLDHPTRRVLRDTLGCVRPVLRATTLSTLIATPGRLLRAVTHWRNGGDSTTLSPDDLTTLQAEIDRLAAQLALSAARLLHDGLPLDTYAGALADVFGLATLNRLALIDGAADELKPLLRYAYQHRGMLPQRARQRAVRVAVANLLLDWRSKLLPRSAELDTDDDE